MFAICFGTFSCNQSPGTIHDDFKLKDFSIAPILSNPDQYDGKKVTAIGYFSFGFENVALYLHKDDYEKHNSQNALWLEIIVEVTKMDRLAKFNNKYICIQGTFDAKKRGHDGNFSGAIVNITRLEPLNPPPVRQQ